MCAATYYRGVPLALFESAYVNVDGEVYGPDSMRVLVDGEMFEFKDMCDVTLHYWNKGYPAKLIIRKPGGLSKGVHDISAIAEILFTICGKALLRGEGA